MTAGMDLRTARETTMRDFEKKYLESLGPAAAAARTASDDPKRSPESMVPAIVYLASKESGWLNGNADGEQCISASSQSPKTLILKPLR